MQGKTTVYRYTNLQMLIKPDYKRESLFFQSAIPFSVIIP